jgi:hypothetical protein
MAAPAPAAAPAASASPAPTAAAVAASAAPAAKPAAAPTTAPVAADSKANVAAGGVALFEPVSDVLRVYSKELSAMKAALKPPGAVLEEGDITLYRFLRGYKLVVPDAVAAVNRMLEWRAVHKIDSEVKLKADKCTSQNDYPFADKVHRCVSIVHNHGFDKKGQPRTYLHARTHAR